MACRNSAGISYPHCNLSYGQTDGRTNGQVPVTTNCKISLGKLSRRPKERRINEQQIKNPKEKPTKSGLKRNEQWVEMVQIYYTVKRIYKNSGQYDGARVPKYYRIFHRLFLDVFRNNPLNNDGSRLYREAGVIGD